MRVGSEREPIHDVHLRIDCRRADSCGLRIGHTLSHINAQSDDSSDFDRRTDRNSASAGSTAAPARDPAQVESTGRMPSLSHLDCRWQPRPASRSRPKEPGRLPGMSRLGSWAGGRCEGDSGD